MSGERRPRRPVSVLRWWVQWTKIHDGFSRSRTRSSVRLKERAEHRSFRRKGEFVCPFRDEGCPQNGRCAPGGVWGSGDPPGGCVPPPSSSFRVPPQLLLLTGPLGLLRRIITSYGPTFSECASLDGPRLMTREVAGAAEQYHQQSSRKSSRKGWLCRSFERVPLSLSRAHEGCVAF